MKRFNFWLSTGVFVILLLSSGGATLAERLTEPKGLVTFDMPAGWSNDRFKNGRHFTRAGVPDDPNVLGVVAERRDEYMTLEKMSEGRKRVNDAQGRRMVFEKTTQMNGFDVWEGAFEVTVRDQEVVFHSYLMFSDALMVDVHLNSSKPVYKDYLPDLRVLVQSIRLTEAGKEGKRPPPQVSGESSQ